MPKKGGKAQKKAIEKDSNHQQAKEELTAKTPKNDNNNDKKLGKRKGAASKHSKVEKETKSEPTKKLKTSETASKPSKVEKETKSEPTKKLTTSEPASKHSKVEKETKSEPTKKLETSEPASKPSKVKKETKSEPTKKLKPSESNGIPEVSKHLAWRDEVTVFVENDKVYHAELDDNKYFYLMQLLQRKDNPETFHYYCRYGKIGSEGNVGGIYKFHDKAEAIRVFEKCVKQRLRKGYRKAE